MQSVVPPLVSALKSGHVEAGVRAARTAGEIGEKIVVIFRGLDQARRKRGVAGWRAIGQLARLIDIGAGIPSALGAAVRSKNHKLSLASKDAMHRITQSGDGPLPAFLARYLDPQKKR